MAIIDIKDLEKNVVIFNLYNSSKAVKNGAVAPASNLDDISWLTCNPGKRTPEEGKLLGAIHLGFMQTTKRTEFNSALYDAQNSSGAAARTITEMRQQQQLQTH